MNKKRLKMLVVIGAMVSVLSTGMVAFAAEEYTVQKGDYLKKIAKQVYGDEEKWETIYEANNASIKNPNLIYEGQIFILPDAENVATAPITEVPVTDETPISTEAPTITETSINTTMSLEEAMEVWNSFWNDPNQCLAYFDDATLSFFDKNNDQTINQEEHDALMRWVIYANDTNTDNNTADMPLDDAETIAMATKLKEGKLIVPDKLFNVDYASGLWIKY
ncbi:MAG: LysM peptidoglycan-binding domain-containing protein [Lachnospiraceae bacterium]|nr:LysM peptidoglycan-binding domain-containing protein [Lachnospiraceae bacterium]